MPLSDTMSLDKMIRLDEPFFEPIARLVRFARGSLELRQSKPMVVVDIGCGPKIRFFRFARRIGIHMSRYYGLDPLLTKDTIASFHKETSVTLSAKPIMQSIPLPDNTADCVVAFAFLEHVDNPSVLLSEMIRILKPGGRVVITTPSNIARPVLEFLSYRLHLISKREIDEHKNYFSKKSLLALLSPSLKKHVSVKHRYFECFLNNLFVITKHETV